MRNDKYDALMWKNGLSWTVKNPFIDSHIGIDVRWNSSFIISTGRKYPKFDEH